MLYNGGLRNMENNIKINFIKENTDILLNIEQPDLTNLIKNIISKHLEVTKENIKVDADDTFDIDEFINLILSVHEEFREEIDKFYENINREITTYYEDDVLAKHIIEELKKNT